MTLTWRDNITDLSSTREDGPVGDVDALYLLYGLLSRMPPDEPTNIAWRIEGKVIGFTVERHNEMGEAP